MTKALTLEGMSPGLVKVVERAQREPAGRFHSLAHLIDVAALEHAYHRQRANAAVGVDGVTKEQYGQDLEAHRQALHARLKAKRYRHQPIRRVHSTFPRDKERHDRSASRRSRTNWSRMPCARSSKPSTSRTSWTVRMAFGPNAAPTTSCGP